MAFLSSSTSTLLLSLSSFSLAGPVHERRREGIDLICEDLAAARSSQIRSVSLHHGQLPCLQSGVAVWDTPTASGRLPATLKTPPGAMRPHPLHQSGRHVAAPRPEG